MNWARPSGPSCLFEQDSIGIGKSRRFDCGKPLARVTHKSTAAQDMASCSQTGSGPVTIVGNTTRAVGGGH